MNRRVMSIVAGGALLLMGAIVPAGVASAGSSAWTSTRKAALLEAKSSPLGTILVDAKGRTVYLFAADSKGKSACDASCLEYWPAVVAPATLPKSLPGVSGKLGFLKRSDGVRQLTINGLPLYTYKADTAKGAVNGQGINASGAKWWAVAPSGARVTKMPSSASTPSTPATTPGGGTDYAY